MCKKINGWKSWESDSLVFLRFNEVNGTLSFVSVSVYYYSSVCSSTGQQIFIPLLHANQWTEKYEQYVTLSSMSKMTFS